MKSQSSIKVDNKYILEKSIGSGSFGQVYLTKVKGEKGKLYATKLYEKSEVEKNNMKKYLLNELNIHLILDHPNICKLVDFKRSKSRYYFIFEYCNGGELDKALEKYKQENGHPFPEELVQHFMKQIIECFNYIHEEKKIIHRDVKLSNIMLNYENEEDLKNFNLMKAQIKIIDFGFSCLIGPNGLSYSFLGTPLTMAPIMLKKK